MVKFDLFYVIYQFSTSYSKFFIKYISEDKHYIPK